MKKILYFAIPLALIVLIAVRLKSNKETSLNRIYTYNKEQAIEVRTDTVKYIQTGIQKSFTGLFEPDKETKVSADVQGKIVSVFVDAGSYVKKGQSLIKIDDALLNLQLQSVSIQIEGLETDVKRYLILAESDAIQGVQLEKTQLALKSAQVQRSTLLEQISRTIVAAPFNGIVTLKMTEAGSYAAPGVPLLQLTDISSLRFTIQVPENDLTIFHNNQAVDVFADLYPSISLAGKISLIGSKGNMANSFPIQALVKNTQDMKIKSGMFGKIVIEEKLDEKQLTIPASAIVGSTLKPQVYVVEQGKAKLRDITIADRKGSTAVIQSGLREGEMVITNGLINLFDGATVESKN